MAINFADTGYARKLFDADIPRAIEALEKIAKELEEANRLKAEEIKLKLEQSI